MVCCSAVNCSNSSKKGYRLFRFPRDETRRMQWLQNCRRNLWKPSLNATLCEVHFENNQFELHRADGWKKLKPNAIPILFNVPNPPKKFISSPRKSKYKRTVNIVNAKKTDIFQRDTELEHNYTYTNVTDLDVSQSYSISELRKILKSLLYTYKIQNMEQAEEIKKLNSIIAKYLVILQKDNEELERNIKHLESEAKKYKNLLSRYFSSDQIKCITQVKMKEWTKESIIAALKIRFGLGVHGYNFLRNLPFPLPSYSTLNRRIQGFQMTTGVLESFLEPLAYKVQCMDISDKYCAMSIDEMQINSSEDYNKYKNQFMGYISMGNRNLLGTHLLVILIRGIKNSWKQVIACEVTGNSTDASLVCDLIHKCIEYVEKCGLFVVSLTSDMGYNNCNLWTKLNVGSKKDGFRSNTFISNNHLVYVIPDVCYLLKNLRNAIQKHKIELPIKIIQLHGLKSNIVSGEYVSSLWKAEIGANKILRTLYHLTQKDITPNNFEKMHVGSAMRYFSEKTAAGLELAVHLKILPPNALTTAWFIKLISNWFELVTSRIRKRSITRRNQVRKKAILLQIIDIFQDLRIIEYKKVRGSEKIIRKWKPLNSGMVLANLSLFDISNNFLLTEKLYDFLLFSRFTQDGLENVFSQIRKRVGQSPSVLQCFQALKIITISQFITDVKHSSYSKEPDIFLLDVFAKKKSMENNTFPAINTTYTKNLDFATNFETILIKNISDIKNSGLTLYDLNVLLYVSGCCINAIFKRSICNECRSFICNNLLTENEFRIYIKQLDKGGLKTPNYEIFNLIVNCEIIYKKYEHYLLHHNFNIIIKKIVDDINIDFPLCSACDLKNFIVNHFLKIRSYSISRINITKKKKLEMYGTSSAKKRKV